MRLPGAPRRRTPDVIGKCLEQGVFTGFLGKMTAPLKSIEGSGDIAAAMKDIGRRARAAARVLALAPAEQKNRALQLMAAAVRGQVSSIRDANSEDVTEPRPAAATRPFLHRPALDPP